MDRRGFILGLGLGAWAAPGWARAESVLPTAPEEELEIHDLKLPGDPRVARRSLVLIPRQASALGPLPLLVLLHGLGETGNELLGIHAWRQPYGLALAHARLRHPPVVRTMPKSQYLSDERLLWINQSLQRRPYGAVVVACPVTPNPWRSHLRPAALVDYYADWLEEILIPSVRRLTPLATGRYSTGLDGCSLGGYVALEVFLRKPALFGTVGCVQGAMAVDTAPLYARRIAAAIDRVGPRPIHLESSGDDPYRIPTLALAKSLSTLCVPHDLIIPPGPHNQPWLREVGTLEMLLWHERQLRGAVSEPL